MLEYGGGMMVRFASNDMIDELKNLWCECFEGDDEYCRFFFEHYFSCENCVVFTNDHGEVEAAVHMFRGAVTIGGKPQQVLFLYAGATFAQHRKKGRLTALLGYIEAYCREQGIGIVSASLEETSRPVCEKNGMRPVVNMRAASMVRNRAEYTYPCEECGYDEFALMRNEYLNREFNIYWTEKSLRYMHAEMKTSGDIVKVFIDDCVCYAAYTCLEDELLIRETNCPAKDMSALVDSLCAHIGYKGKVTVYTRADTILRPEDAISQDTFCYAHIWFIDETLDVEAAEWYINLTAE